MAFVSGLMGPYMRPIPVGASAAMLLSLLIAFIISPWLSFIVLKRVKNKPGREDRGGRRPVARRLQPALRKELALASGERPAARSLRWSWSLVLLGAAMILVPLKWVTLKMLPFDNKSELQVMIDHAGRNHPGGNSIIDQRD